MMKWLLPKMAISLTLAVVAALTLISITEVSYRRSRAAILQVEEAQNARSAINKLLQQMQDAETGQRDYLLTGEDSYLEPYNRATADIKQTLEVLQHLLTPHAEELAEFEVLSQHILRKLSEIDASLQKRRSSNTDGWNFFLTTDAAKQQMETIRNQAAKLSATSAVKGVHAQEKIQKTLQFSRIGVSVMALAGLLAIYFYLTQTSALISAGKREKESWQRERDQLDLEVRERTANLVELATHLQNVREDERGHLARELHDELGALLTAAKLDVVRLKSRLAGNLPEASERLAHLTNTLNSGIALKRRIVEDLRPSSLLHLGLVASLEILARESEERLGLIITTDLEYVDLDGAAQLTVYRLVQESLTNIAKYAEANNAFITLRNMDSYTTAEVRDDGKGFDLSNVATTGHGLTGMRHRVEAAGGRLSIESTLGNGVRISAVLPKPLANTPFAA